MRNYVTTALTLVVIGVLCHQLALVELPVAWMIGAVVCAGALNLAGRPLPLVPRGATAGLAVISATVGLSFTPEALRAVGAMFPAMLLAAILSLAATLLAARVLMRYARTGYLAACISLLTVGPVESSLMAQQYRLDPSPVIFSQMLRFIAVVLILPPLIFFLNSAAPGQAAGQSSSTLQGSLLLLLASGAGAFLALRLRLPNAWFLGPAITALALQLAGVPLTPPPGFVLATAQFAMGIWLGSVLNRDFLRRSPSYAVAATIATVALLIVSAAIGGLVMLMTGVSWQVGMMATAPGASTEMALTAKSMGLGVATVVGFHAVRIMVIYFAGAALIAGIDKWLRHRGG